jgi:hypothetical protein
MKQYSVIMATTVAILAALIATTTAMATSVQAKNNIIK